MRKRCNRYRDGIIQTAVATAAVLCVRAATVQATTYYWDTNGSAAGQGSATSPVSWLTGSNWATSSGGTSATGTWPNTNPNSDAAVFGGTKGTVLVDNNVFVNSIEFDTATYSINGSGSNYLTLSGTSPSVSLNLATSGTVNFAMPLAGTNGFTVNGNSSSKVLMLINTDTTNVNTFSGGITINLGGFVRLGGGSLTQQLPHQNDLTVMGIIDFNTAGALDSNGKHETVRNVNVSGSSAVFSVGNGTNFEMNSLSANSTSGVSVNGNGTTSGAGAMVQPGMLNISGWNDGQGNVSLNDASIRLNTTSGLAAEGGEVLLAGSLTTTSTAAIYNVNSGNATTPGAGSFAYQGMLFTSSAQTINVTSGTLLFSSASAIHPLEIQSTAIGGTTLTKTGPGEWILANAVETTFTGTNRIDQGTLTLGASERLADASTLTVSGGALNMQGFSETVGSVNLTGGTIAGTSGAALTSTQGFAVQNGYVSAKLSSSQDLVKSTGGSVTLMGLNNYSGKTREQAGTLLVGGTVGTGTLSVEGGQAKFTSGAPTSVVAGLSIASGASLDLSNNSLVIDYTGASAAGSLSLLRGYLNAADGRLNTSALTTDQRIGYRDNQDTSGKGMNSVSTFDGAAVDPSSVLIGYTYAGDTNLDGDVDISDLYNLAAHYNQPGTWNWAQGDFDYNGTVDINDLKLLAAEWNKGVSGSPAPALGPLLTSLGLPDVTVPEPASISLVAFCAAGVLARRLRRRTPALTC